MKRVAIILLLVFANVSCDQISKKMAREQLITNERVQVINDNLILTKVENSGAAYSFGSNWNPLIKTIVLKIIPALVLLLLLGMLLYKTDYPKMVMVGFTFVIGGGIGNVFDRIVHGSVTDFLYVDLGFFATEIFNMADVSIVIGALIILIHSITGKKEMPSLNENLS